MSAVRRARSAARRTARAVRSTARSSRSMCSCRSASWVWNTAAPSSPANSAAHARPATTAGQRRLRGDHDQASAWRPSACEPTAVTSASAWRRPQRAWPRFGPRRDATARRTSAIRPVGVGDRIDLLDDPQPCRGGATVAVALGGARALGNAAHEADGLHRSAHARQVGRALAGAGGDGEPLLDDAVLTGVVREHGDAAARARRLDGLVERVGQHVELAVDLDPNRLERPLRRMSAGAAGRRPGSRR